jgi:hypothetical protein
MGGLFARGVGQWPRIVLPHGVSVGEFTWREQLPLAERFTLVVVERPGYGPQRLDQRRRGYRRR